MPRLRPPARLALAHELLPLLRATVARGGHFAFVARGDSMRPAILDGDRLVVGPVAQAELSVGDVVVWSHRKRVVVHRVTALSARTVTTRGDGCAQDDRAVPRAAVVARVVRRERTTRAFLRNLGRFLPAQLRQFLGGLLRA